MFTFSNICYFSTNIKLWKISFATILMAGIVLIVRPPFIFPPKDDGNVTSSALWDISADDTRGNGGNMTLFTLDFWTGNFQVIFQVLRANIQAT